MGRVGRELLFICYARPYAKYFAFCSPIKSSQPNVVGVVIVSASATLVGFKIKKEGSTNVIFGGTGRMIFLCNRASYMHANSANHLCKSAHEEVDISGKERE